MIVTLVKGGRKQVCEKQYVSKRADNDMLIISIVE